MCVGIHKHTEGAGGGGENGPRLPNRSWVVRVRVGHTYFLATFLTFVNLPLTLCACERLLSVSPFLLRKLGALRNAMFWLL